MPWRGGGEWGRWGTGRGSNGGGGGGRRGLLNCEVKVQHDGRKQHPAEFS